MKKRAIILNVGYKCINNCRFCVVKDRKNTEKFPLKSLKESIEFMQGSNRIYLTGGEPTIRQDIEKIIEYANKFYDEVWLQSNGRLFSDEKFTKRLVDKGLHGCLVSIHSHIPETQDFLTQVDGSYKQTTKGIRNMLVNGMEVNTNTVITKYNFKELDETVKFLETFKGIEHMCFTYPTFIPYLSKEDVVPLREISEYVERALKESTHVVCRDICLCVIDLRRYNIANPDYGWKIGIVNGKTLYENGKKIFLSKCEKCYAKPECQGLPYNYDNIFEPSLDIKPLSK